MSLRPEEIDRCRFELGVPLTRIGAEPYIAFIALFDRVIQPYLFDNATTSSTTVTAVAAGAVATLALAANPFIPGSSTILTFQVGTSCLVDVGPSQETGVIQSLTGLNAQITLVNAHSGTYPVSAVGSEQIVRDILTRLDVIRVALQTIAPPSAGVESVDDIRMFPAGSGRKGKVLDKFQSLVMQRKQAREDLGEALGCGTFRRSGGGSSIGVY